MKQRSQHILTYITVTAMLVASAAGVAATQPPGATAPPASLTVAADPCGGSPRCYSAGTFIAEVVQVSPSAMVKGARNQVVSLNIRFRNVSDKPIILAYRNTSGTGRDNFGQQFFYGRPNADASVKGMGVVDTRNADPQFMLAPGQSRAATFTMIRFNARPPIGESFGYDLVIDELAILPGQQIRSVRQNSLTFTNLAPGSMVGASLTDSNLAPGGAPVTHDPTEVAGKMIDLFNKLKK